MILKDFERFLYHIPTAVGTEESAIKPYWEEAENRLKTELLGESLYAHIENLNTGDIVVIAETVVSLWAYQLAIPFADLIQTPTGFGIVNNQNLVPASKDRVDRLIEQTKFRLSISRDALIRIVFNDDELRGLWSEFELFEQFTSIVYITGSDLSRFSNTKVIFGTLDSSRTNILQLQDELSKYISPEYITTLFMKFRNAGMHEYDKKVFLQMQIIIGLMLQKLEVYPMIEKLVNYMVENIEQFPDFETSQAYKLKIGSKYENRLSDRTFFFGG